MTDPKSKTADPEPKGPVWTAKRAAFTREFIGVDIPPNGGSGGGDAKARPGDQKAAVPPAKPGSAAPVTKVDPGKVAVAVRRDWSTAIKKVDGQLASLLKSIRADPSAEAKVLADIGLASWTSAERARIDTAIDELAATPADAFDRAARTRAIAAFQDHARFIGTHPAVKIIEQNPWNVAVDLSGALPTALKQMEVTVQSA